jgi:hypothetical protein
MSRRLDPKRKVSDMKKEAGRYNGEAGIERVDHNGVTHVVTPHEIEVSRDERQEWYNNGRPDEEQRLVHKRKNIVTQYDDGGNPMWVNEEHRTSLPRPHQFSMERRLVEQRKPGSTYDTMSDATRQQALALAFSRVSAIVIAGDVLENKKVLAISKDAGLPVEEVFSLDRIARRDQSLAKKYAACLSKEIPGVAEDAAGAKTVKEGLPEEEPKAKCKTCPAGKLEPAKKGEMMTAEELAEVGKKTGLCD